MMMPTPEDLKLLGSMAPLAFFDALAAAGLGAPIVAVLCEISSRTRKKVFLEKLAQQLSAMGLLLQLLTFVVGGVCTVLLAQKLPALSAWALRAQSPIAPVAGAMFLALLASAMYRLTWKSARTARAAHVCIGLLAALAAIAATLGGVALLRSVAVNGMGEASLGLPLLEHFRFPAGSLAWPLAAQSLALLAAYAGAFGLIHLILRRAKDDFGRDYYRYAPSVAAAWALAPMLAALALSGWLYAELPEITRFVVFHGVTAPLLAAAGTTALLACLLWLILARSQTPMRLKGLMVLAALLVWAVHTLAATALFQLYMLR